MISATHPVATALAARFLAHPEDRLGRLVLADWLEEQGGESNLAWAEYLRLGVHGKDDHERRYGERTVALRRAIRTRLLLRRVPGVSVLTHLSDFLPPERIDIRLAEADIPDSAWDVCAPKIWRGHLTVPVAAERDVLYAVSAICPGSHDRVAVRLFYAASRRVVLFRGEADEVRAAQNRRFGSPEVLFPDDE